MGILPTCEEMSKLASVAREHNVPLLKRIFMTIHLIACRHCKAAAEQLEILHDAAGRMDDFCMQEDPDRGLPPEVAQRIKDMLKCPPSDTP